MAQKQSRRSTSVTQPLMMLMFDDTKQMLQRVELHNSYCWRNISNHSQCWSQGQYVKPLSTNYFLGLTSSTFSRSYRPYERSSQVEFLKASVNIQMDVFQYQLWLIRFN